MRKIQTDYELEFLESSIIVKKNDRFVANIPHKEVSYALEAIFCLEGKNENDWFVYEDDKVFLVNREEYEKE